MNTTATTTAKLASGESTALLFGAEYVFGVSGPQGRDDVVSGRLESRAANGDLVVLVDSSGTTRRVRPSKVISVFGSHALDGDDLPTYSGPIVPDFLDDETGDQYLARLERTMGSSYTRWVSTETGQAALEAANARTFAGRRGIATEDVEVEPPHFTEEEAAEVLASHVVDVEELDNGHAVIRVRPSRPRKNVTPKIRSIETAPSAKKAKPPTVVRTSGTAKPYSERNQVWRCIVCKRRTRQPFCTGPADATHARVEAPAGKRRSDR